MPVLAFMGNYSGAIIYICVLACILLALVVLAWIAYRCATRTLAHTDKQLSPAQVFGATAGMTFLWAVTHYGVGLILFHHLTSHSPSFWIGALPALAVGMLLFSVMSRSPKLSLAASGAKPPRGPFQFWTQDLLLALLCYGAWLALLSSSFITDACPFLIRAGYLLVAETLALLFAIDLSRREDWTRAPLHRGLVFILAFALFPLTLPLALIAWWRWRRTLVFQARLAYAARQEDERR